MKTIKQIADKFGVSKQAIQKRLSREPLKSRIEPYIEMIDGTKYIDDNGEKIIKSLYTTTDASINKGIDTENFLYATLQKELDAKNRQIEELQAENKELLATIQIQAQSINVDRHNKLADTMRKALTDSPSTTVAPESSLSFFVRLSRILGRRKEHLE